MSRILTALVIGPLALLALFRLSGWGFVVFALLLVEMAAIEFALLTSKLAGRKVMWLVPLLVPVAVILLLPKTGDAWLSPTDRLLVAGYVASVVVSVAALLRRLSLEETIVATGMLSFGIFYFSVPVVALVRLRELDVWLVVLVLAIVWAGDTAAYYIGTTFGRTKLAPTVSPNKTWEGAAASLMAAVLAAVVWSALRLGEVEGWVLMVAIATSIAAQLGDLVESAMKRRVGVKDSSALLPGHGGMLDRLDSLLFALPTLAIGLLVAGWKLP